MTIQMASHVKYLVRGVLDGAQVRFGPFDAQETADKTGKTMTRCGASDVIVEEILTVTSFRSWSAERLPVEAAPAADGTEVVSVETKSSRKTKTAA